MALEHYLKLKQNNPWSELYLVNFSSKETKQQVLLGYWHLLTFKFYYEVKRNFAKRPEGPGLTMWLQHRIALWQDNNLSREFFSKSTVQ